MVFRQYFGSKAFSTCLLNVFPHFCLLDPTRLSGKDQVFFFGEQGVYEKMKQSQSFKLVLKFCMFCIEYEIIFCFPCEQVTSSRFTCVGGIASRVKERSPNFQIFFFSFFFVGFSSQHHHTNNHSFGFFLSSLKDVSWDYKFDVLQILQIFW